MDLDARDKNVIETTMIRYYQEARVHPHGETSRRSSTLICIITYGSNRRTFHTIRENNI